MAVSQIRRYYKDRVLLVTGGTGFVGQALVAKVLRELGDEAGRIYLLIRPKRRADGRVVAPQERLDGELFAGALFQWLRAAGPERWQRLRAKIVAVPFHPGRPQLGLDPQDWQRLAGQVDTIFNSAATVVFDEPLDVSVQANARGPLALLELARAAGRRVDFVHVSTAYVNGRRTGVIPDEPLPPDRDMRQIIDGTGPGFDAEAEVADCEAFCRRVREEGGSDAVTERLRHEILRQYRRNDDRRAMTDARLKQLVEDRRTKWVSRRLVGEGMRRGKAHGWTDVYTYTKAMGEQLLVRRRGDVPLVIVRPSIIESSWADPEPGWITGLKVMDPLLAAYGRGLIPDFPARPDIVLDVVPVDLVVNTCLAAATAARPDGVEVFHIATGSQNPVRLGEMFDSVRAHFLRAPMRDRDGNVPPLPVWRYRSLALFRAAFHLRYLYPIRVREWLLGLPGRSPSPRQRRLLGTAKVRFQRVLYYVDIYHPYTHLDCRFATGRTRALFESLDAGERAAFDFDVTRIDWRRYVEEIHLPGLRRHVLRDADAAETVLPEAPEEPTAEEERLQAEAEIRTIPDLLRWAASRHADRIAFEARRGDVWESRTYAALLDAVERRAAHWRQLGIAPGDRVLLSGENGLDWVESYLAASILGAAVIPVDPQTPHVEIASLARFSAARVIVAPAAVLAAVAATGAGGIALDLATGAPPGAVLAPGAACRAALEALAIWPEMEASVIFTSGTRVDPRGVVLTHGNFIADLHALAQVQRVYEDDRLLSLLPLHHGLEFTGALLTSLWGGATTIYLDAPLNSRRILEAVRERGVTAMLAVPRILKILADRVLRLDGARAPEPGAVATNAATLRQLRLIVSGGAPLDGVLFDTYRQLGLTVYEGYGLTETGPIVTVNPPGGARRGSVGLPLPGVQVRIDAATGGAEGEILVRGPTVTPGYLGRPDLTARVLRDGWLHTGDLGRLDADGYLYITGRSRELIVTGAGKNVYPEEVEDLYAGLPHAAELAVVGVRSTRTQGEECHAAVVLDRRARGDGAEAAAEEIRQCAYALSRDLPTYQRIARLHLWQRPLPRLDDGRVDRQALRAELERTGAGRRDVDGAEGLAPWERRVYLRVSQLTGLAVSEVVAHADAPLDTVIDSLMAAELGAFLQGPGPEAPRIAIDRARKTLRQLLDELAPAPPGPQPDAAAAPEYWRAVLTGAAPAGPRGAGLAAAAARVLRGVLRIEVEGAQCLPAAGPFLCAAHPPVRGAFAAVVAALRPRLEGLCLVVERDDVLGRSWEGRLCRALADVVVLGRFGRLEDGLRVAAARLGERRPLLLFPQAQRQTRAPGPLKAGVGLLALELNLPVIPVHVAASRSGARAGARVRIGAAVEPGPFRERRQRLSAYEVYREIAEVVRDHIAQLGAAPSSST